MSDFKIPQWATTPSQPASLRHPGSSNDLIIDQKAYYLFGRDVSLAPDFVIEHPSVSRRHAALVHHDNGNIYIIDLASREGVVADGHRIPPNKPTHLYNGSNFTIGPATYIVHCSVVARSNNGPAQVRASHLLVKHRNSRRPSSWKEKVITRSPEEALAMVQSFREEIVSGRANFAELAKVESDCSSARAGGDLHWFGRGQMQKVFEDATYALEIDQISEPVSSDSGVHIIMRTG